MLVLTGDTSSTQKQGGSESPGSLQRTYLYYGRYSQYSTEYKAISAEYKGVACADVVLTGPFVDPAANAMLCDTDDPINFNPPAQPWIYSIRLPYSEEKGLDLYFCLI